MKKYHFNILINDFKTNAGSKAVSDCKKILMERSYVDIDVSFVKNPLLLGVNVFKLLYGLINRYFKIEPGSLIIVQYPLKGINRPFKHFITLMKRKRCSFIAIVHDLDSLRYKKSTAAVRAEIDTLNAYDVVISHNEKMTSWLHEKGLKTQVQDLMIFDYLYEEGSSEKRSDLFAAGSREVSFAGSLGRGRFIFGLWDLGQHLTFRLYGPNIGSEPIENSNRIFWEGSFSAEDLVCKLKGNFGLIWDGDSLESCGGAMGDYIAYNNPHKLSLYLAACLPVIVPKKAALADWLTLEGLGIAVDNLYELEEKLAEVSPEQYSRMLLNASAVSSKLKQGFYFNNALSAAEEYIRRQKMGNGILNENVRINEKDIS